MTMVVKCKCGKEYRVRDELQGKKARCPACGSVLIVPAQESLAKPLGEVTCFESGAFKVTDQKFFYPRGWFRSPGCLDIQMMRAVQAKRYYGDVIGWVIGVLIFFFFFAKTQQVFTGVVFLICLGMAINLGIRPRYALYVEFSVEDAARQRVAVEEKELILSVKDALDKVISQ